MKVSNEVELSYTNKAITFTKISPIEKSLCVFFSHTLLFPSRGGQTHALNSTCKTDQDYFAYWMSFESSNLMEEISPNLKALNPNTS